MIPLIEKGIEPKTDFIMNTTFIISLFYLIIILPYTINHNMFIIYNGINFTFIISYLISGYILFWFYEKIKGYKYEEGRETKDLFRKV